MPSLISSGAYGPVRRGFSLLLAALLLSPGPSLASSGATGAGTSLGSLKVESDPPDAAVFVDGRFAGQTPVAVEKVPAGDHRVRVLKNGYLENRRIVTISVGRPTSVQLKLTPHTGSQVTSAREAQQTSGGGGGSKKWLWIGVAAGGAGAAAFYFATKNAAPIAGTVLVSPATAFTGDTVTFTSQGASDPDGDALSFSWDFGDGASGTGERVTHAYATAGTFTATVTVSDGKKSATATGTVTIRVNNPPVAGTVVITPATTIARTSVSLTAQGANDPDGQPITFSWNFGDGTTGTGQTVSHIYDSAGTFTATVTVSDGRLSATASGSVVVRVLTGQWRGSLSIFNTVVNLSQNNLSLSGTYSDQFPGIGSVSGSVNSSTRAVTFTVTQPPFSPFTFTGTPSADINTLTGTASGSGFFSTPWTLRRQ